ncbi:MAG TPA: polyphosphate kinase 1 [Dehalococcoidales bacterium]|nr:polyphosphate kinase 1 [Dehalococcoidales bacterium]
MQESSPVIIEETNANLPKASALFNRELSWLEFNRRVLEEAQDELTPIVEKLKFASIFSSNLDEYFMVRVGSLFRALEADINEIDDSGKTLRQQLDDIAEKVRCLVGEQYKCITEEILPGLKGVGIHIHTMDELDNKEASRLDKYFETQIFPVLTPLALDAGHPFPFLNNLRLNLMVIFKDTNTPNMLQPHALVEVPSVLPRLVPVNTEDTGHHFILLEDLIRKHIKVLFPGMEIKDTIAMRVTRNHDYNLHETEVMDLLQSVENEIKERSHMIAVRLEMEKEAPKKTIKMLQEQLGIEENFIYTIKGPINICDLMPLHSLPIDARYKDPPFNPRIPPRLAENKDIFTIIREGDMLLHHPYDSFAVVMDFLNTAADDPDVLAIKQTLYRIGNDSPVVAALCRAAENGKQVTAVVELKARFDEQYNIDWTRQMERSGVNVVYGFVRWKIHCKATLVVRREGRHLRRYVHVSSGNYNVNTAKLYTDLGLLTSDAEFGNDVSALFNVLTGFNSWSSGDIFTVETLASMFHKFMISPVTTRDTFLRLIQREIKKSTPKSPGRIIAKLNQLVDKKVIQNLYEASQAGVRIDLLCRGVCCLRPGVSGLSENIRVISILDRFLEHSRIYYFHNGGEPEIYSGSSDWMPRNFDKRAEIVYPIENTELKSRIINEILMTYLNDNVKARLMQPDGSYLRLSPKDGQPPVRSQSALIEIARSGGMKSRPYEEIVKMIGMKKNSKRPK